MGLVADVAVTACALLGLATILLFCYRRHRKRRSRQNGASATASSLDTFPSMASSSSYEMANRNVPIVVQTAIPVAAVAVAADSLGGSGLSMAAVESSVHMELDTTNTVKGGELENVCKL